MKKIYYIFGQILTLGAFEDWQRLSTRDKIILPLSYVLLLVGYYFGSKYLGR